MGLETEVRALVEKMERDVDAVIVEGRRDKDALRAAGFTNTIHTCSDANGLVNFARAIPLDETVTILTDFDQEGKRLNGRLRDLIPGSQVRPIWRKKIGKLLTEHGRRDIESLNNVFDR